GMALETADQARFAFFLGEKRRLFCFDLRLGADCRERFKVRGTSGLFFSLRFFRRGGCWEGVFFWRAFGRGFESALRRPYGRLF
ncbi:hypothetical protein N8Z81_05845, partial [Akkermansiaceae bacterium]|nr:hypothetical protein [Akkermansiaceae bacterium]